MKVLKRFMVLSVLCALFACELNDSMPGSEEMVSAPEKKYQVQQASYDVSEASQENDSQILSQRMVIKTANLSGEIENYETWLEQLKTHIHKHNGYIVDAYTQKAYENARRGSTSLRVPQQNFDLLITDIKKIFASVNSEQIQGKDVTEEFFDLSARLENQEKAEKRLQDILKVAKNVEEILKVEKELTRVRENIERMAGRKKYLENQVSLSTISIEWHEPYPLVAGYGGKGFWHIISDGFDDGVRGFANALGGLITFLIAGLPIFVFIFFVGWLFYRYKGHFGKKEKPVAATAKK